ncbi:MAG: TlpA family protein disulfide reductase [Elusimicrobia bacterium]|nr:TlpA family protein disulfide reductase [Elusimicrobiota bacterium]
MEKIRQMIAGLAAFSIAAGLGYMMSRRVSGGNAPVQLQAKDKKKAVPFTLPDLAGKTVGLSDFQGQVLLVDFWATWCEPCLDELPELIDLHKRYSGRGFSVIGIAVDDAGAEAVGPFARAHRIPYPILLAPGGGVEGFGVYGLPTAFLIDRGGLIVKRYLGPKSVREVSSDLAPLLDSSPP